MSDSEKSKSSPIPTRFGKDELDMIAELSDITGVTKSEIIRRSVKFALEQAKKDANANFLLGDEEEIRSLLENGPKGRGGANIKAGEGSRC